MNELSIKILHKTSVITKLFTVITSIFFFGNTFILAQNSGDLDATFNTGAGPSAAVWNMASQTDGKIIIGGSFTNYNGVVRKYVARVNANGTLDASFDPGTGANSYINVVALQTDEKIIIGGAFTSFNGTTCNHIARLNTDGSLDTSFNIGTGTSAGVSAIAIQSDGKILVGGEFTTYNGTTCNRIARLNTNGTLDASFNSGGSSANDYVSSVTLQPDEKILIGGYLTSYNGIARKYFARLNSDGTLDTSFTPNISTSTNGYVGPFLVQPDGKILAGGSFNKKVKRFNQNGTEDYSFNPTGAGAGGSVSNVNAIELQADGRILISGYFSSYNGTTRKNIARLHSNGSLDVAFNPGSAYFSQVTSINSIIIQSNEKIVIGGLFTQYNGSIQNNLVRLYNCIGSQLIETITLCGGSYTWINGNTYSTSNNSAFHTISGGASNGCDSIVYLNLTINQIATSTDNHTMCAGDSLNWIDGNTYTSNNNSATHTFVGGASNSCDSIVTLNFTVNQPTHNSSTQSACSSFVWHGTTYTTSDIYTYNYNNANGCASTDTLHLIVNDNPTPTITVTNGTELSTQTYSNYQWLLNNNNINGATSQSYTATQNGNYNVYVADNNGCSATSSTFAVSNVELAEILTTNKILKVYPNPTNEFLVIETNFKNIDVKISNVLGKIVFEQNIQNTSSAKINVSSLEDGIYFVKVGTGLHKFVKN